ncbi:glycosyl transferase family 2 [Ancylobacter novellus DSM 506]|uniref:Glycosyl transferase family 2 n=1 Tax=Ancylobacter novellus (strain ATCC 8093 / DSM 506 / JCM 20403 / CCM 1077 / IAM 12100 / NBRC 12443 / NCIMB 10456) TaxID=639283 RepID=D6ZYT3_ANCN5|nr:glycosyltransferase [Ancylobacter novellus]ADH91052.1 glycosyl transferase family 2 [Ancylobacter novellus DSM 506]
MLNAPKPFFLTILLTESGELSDRVALNVLPEGDSSWYVLTDAQVQLHPTLADLIRRYSEQRPDVGIFYGDEVALDEDTGAERDVLLKPSFDVTQLIAQDYVGWPIFIHGRALRRLGLPGEAGTAVTYDLLLRAQAAGIAVERIPEILAVRRGAPRRANLEDRRRVAATWAAGGLGDFDVVPGRRPDTLRLTRRLADHPPVTLVIPTRREAPRDVDGRPAGRPYILDLLESLTTASWPVDRLTVLIGDDMEDDGFYRQREWPFDMRFVATPRAPGERFNYARKMNGLWRLAATEHVVLMNDDLVIATPDWLEALMTFALEPDVGGVGARLLYPSGRLQHVGMAFGPNDACAHLFLDEPGAAPTYGNWADVHREYSVVTGAVFATRRSLLDEINGFEERFSLSWNDVDMCLRLRLLGLRIVYTPHAELTHYESASRGQSRVLGSEMALFLERWRDLFEDDPAYHPRLSRTSLIPTPLPVDDVRWWQRHT